MIMNRKELAKVKLENLKNGYSAFTDSEEIASILKKKLTTLDIPIHVDQTSLGYWFIPEEATRENSLVTGHESHNN